MSRLRDEFLDGEAFNSVLGVQVRVGLWRCYYYNEERLHLRIGYRTSRDFEASWHEPSRQVVGN